ncbi:MAG TPA: hypothetical protein VMN82_16425 [Thermoanaerobaculia bacterium]|nr:hypothetical protein [Thermoanaerobaculia bacterium]
MPSDRPDYKHDPLWTEAMALTRAAYDVASEVAEREPDEALRLRKVAVTVPARVAGALVADEPSSRASEAEEARLAIEEVAARAEKLPTRGGTARELARRARRLEESVVRTLGRRGSAFS